FFSHPRLTLFPYTTLFRSPDARDACRDRGLLLLRRPPARLVGVPHSGRAAARGPDERATRARALRRLARCAERGGEEREPESRRSEEHTSELQSLRHLVCR